MPDGEDSMDEHASPSSDYIHWDTSIVSEAEIQQSDLLFRKEQVRREKRKLANLESLHAMRKKRRQIQKDHIERQFSQLKEDEALLADLKRKTAENMD